MRPLKFYGAKRRRKWWRHDMYTLTALLVFCVENDQSIAELQNFDKHVLKINFSAFPWSDGVGTPR